VVNVVGTNQADHLDAVGVGGILGLGGNDTIVGDSTDNSLCGGDGKDHLDGGSGTDECFGGSGADTFANCETKQQ
jgi:Ca2+-binding RTX toxin-like protein